MACGVANQLPACQEQWATHTPDLGQREDLRRRLSDNLAALAFHTHGPSAAHVGTVELSVFTADIEAAALAEAAAACGTSAAAADWQAAFAAAAARRLLWTVTQLGQPAETRPAANANSSSATVPWLLGNQAACASAAQQAGSQPAGGPPLPAEVARGGSEALGLGRALEVRTALTAVGWNRAAVWGWLEPGSRVLPHVLLRGAGVALGRGREAFEARRQALCMTSCGSASQSFTAHVRRGSEGRSGEVAACPKWALEQGSPPGLQQLADSGLLRAPAQADTRMLPLDVSLNKSVEVKGENMGFVEVADGRVSRLHCCVKLDSSCRHGKPLQAVLVDYSSNGTFLNNEKVPRGKAVPLADGDKVSLVLSVAPLVEQYFVFRSGDPQAGDSDYVSDWIDGALRLFSPLAPPGSRTTALQESPCQRASPSRRRSSLTTLQRMNTSRYTTAEASTLDDLQCQICLGTLRACCALEPCGHNFCATCLSHHFGNLLQSGLPLTCPLRCAQPLRVVANSAVRALVDYHAQRPAGHPAAGQVAAVATRQHSGGSQLAGLVADLPPGEQDFAVMSTLCPLHDDMLPVDAASLKSKQVEVALRQAGTLPTEGGCESVMAALEALARLAWSDDHVREQVAELGGLDTLVAAMRAWPGQEGVQCNGCLALMSLVRGEGEVCQTNQWRVAKAQGVEAIVAAMEAFPDQPMVQLSALLCMIPLALENSMMQAHLTALALGAVLAALAGHPDQLDIQAKGLVVLGVLGQGEDATHDAIRARQLEAGAPAHIARALTAYGAGADEVLWAALFALAVLVREGSAPFPPATRAVAGAGVLGGLAIAMREYKVVAQQREDGGDEMIIMAGDYLMKTLAPAATALAWQRRMFLAVGVGLPALTVAVALLARHRRLH